MVWFCFSDVDGVVNQSQMREVTAERERKFEELHRRVLMKAQELRQFESKPKKKSREFKQPEHENNIEEFGRKRFAPQSKKKMLWAVNLYDQWRKNRIGMTDASVQIFNADLQFYKNFTKDELCYSLCRFVREVKRLDGNDYPPNTIRELVIMVQMYLHENGVFWKLFDDQQFATLRNVVDNTMKERHGAGLGVRRSSEIITLEHEDKLFSQSVLGEENPLQLLRTIIYMLGMHCALRGGVEHSNLRRPGCNSQFRVERDNRNVERLLSRRPITKDKSRRFNK